MTSQVKSAIERYAQASATFDAKLEQARALLVQAAREHPARVSQASSLSVEDMVVTHLINELGLLDIEIFVLDTGKLHAQTISLLEQLRLESRAPIKVYQPVEESVVRFVEREGTDAMYRSIELRKACCQIRKIEPRERALAGKTAWITGLRREQSSGRADVPFVDVSEPRVKFNPLVDWTWGDLWHYIQCFGVPYNSLHDEFYPSIGCEPCTRAIAIGEDLRAGRWWWEDEAGKECGLHVKNGSVKQGGGK